MDWLKLALGVVQLLGFAVSYLKERKLIDSVGASLLADALRGQADEISNATAARDKVRTNAARDPDSILRDNDGFKRD